MSRGSLDRARRTARLIELASQISRGNADALADFYDLTSAPVYGLALSVLQSPELATTATQEIYAEVWRTAVHYDRSQGSAQAWLMTMAHRHIAERARGAAGGPRPERPAVRARRLGRIQDRGVTWPETNLARRAVDSLSEPHRQAVTLAYFEGYDQREVGRALGLPLGTVKTHLKEGLVGLREAMGVRS